MDHYKQHFTYPSSNNEDVIHVTVWQPMKPRAIVQICHGMCEYVEPVSYTHLDVYKRQVFILLFGQMKAYGGDRAY